MLYYSFHRAPFPHCFRCPNDCEWRNTPCSHKLWCTDCRKWAVKVVGNDPHMCVVCNSDVTTMIQTDPTPVRVEVGSSSSFPLPEIPWEGNEDSHLMTCHGETNANPSTSSLPGLSILNLMSTHWMDMESAAFLGLPHLGSLGKWFKLARPCMTSHGETDVNSLNTSDGYEVSHSLRIPSSRIPRESIQLSPPMTFHFVSRVNPSDGCGVSNSLGTSSYGIPREVVQVCPSMPSPGETDVNSLSTSNSLGIPSSRIPRESIQLSPPMTLHFETHVNLSDEYGVSSSLWTSSSRIPRESVQVGPSMTSHGETDVNLSHPSYRYIGSSIGTFASGIPLEFKNIKIGHRIDPQARKKQLRKEEQESRDLGRKKNGNHEQQ